MKPAFFDLRVPTALREAVELLVEAGPEGRVIGGGQSLVPMMNFRIATPSTLVDLRGIGELDAVAVGSAGDLEVGANVTMTRLLEAPETAGWPMLREALTHVGHPQIRNRGTVCGSLAHNDPSAELPAVATAYGAELVLVGSAGSRVVPAEDFFVSYYETSLRPGELVASVRFPPRPEEGWGFAEFARKHGDFALVGAAATVTAQEGSVAAARLVLFGVDERPRRLTEVEDLLVGVGLGTDADAAADALATVAELIHPVDDSRASAQLRRELAVEMSRDALHQAWERR